MDRRYNVYLVGLFNQKAIAIRAKNVDEIEANAWENNINEDRTSYTVQAHEVGSRRDLELAEDLKEY